MKRIIIPVLLILLNISRTLSAQSSPSINWEKCIGGVDADIPYSVISTSDGGYIIAGSTNSNDGDVSGNHGQGDVWLIKINLFGIIQWQKCFGGSRDDFVRCIIQMSDGGFAF